MKSLIHRIQETLLPTHSFALTISFVLLCILSIGDVWSQVVLPSNSATPSNKKITATSSSGANTLINNTSRRNNGNSGLSGNDSTSIDSVQQSVKGVVFHEDIPDEVLLGGTYIFHYVPGCVKINEIEFPSFSAYGLNYFDRLDAINGQYFLSKGGIGLSHYSIYPTFGEYGLWRYQPDINNGYGKEPTSVKFFQAQRPYTVLGYASSLNKEYQIKVAHTQNITPRWNISFDIDYINPEEIYSNSAAKNSYLDITTNYYSPDSRYQIYAGLIWQKLRMGENGGLTSDSIFTGNGVPSNLSGMPVNSSTRRATFNDLTLFTHQSYNFVRQVERVYSRSRVETIDSNRIDTIYWFDTIRPSGYNALNAGVVGLDISYNRWKHALQDTSATDSTITKALSTDIYWTNDAYPDAKWKNPLKVTLGVELQLHNILEKDSAEYKETELRPHLSLEKNVWRGTMLLKLSHTLESEFMNAPKDYALTYTLPLDSLRNIELSAKYAAVEPYFFYEHHHGNGYHWDNEGLNNTSFFKGYLKYVKEDKFEVTLTANNIRDHIWLNSSQFPEQGKKPFWLLQACAIYHVKLFGWLRYDMQQMLQYSSDESQMCVPAWATKNSLYTDVSLFRRALTLQVGVDIRYHTLFCADAYSPQLGAFYSQGDVKIGNYLWGDFFVNLQLRRAVIYAKAGHLNSLWESHPNYFILPHYPGNKFGIYYGVLWKFFD